MIEQYPQMLYHVVLDPITVENEKDETYYLSKGWSRTPLLFDEIKMLKAKIAFYEGELIILKNNLYAMTQKKKALTAPEKSKYEGELIT